MSRPAPSGPRGSQRTASRGRPRTTSHGSIEQAALALFEERGFEATTLEDIATALDVGRRTLFRYYASKNDILWGRFDDSLRHLEEVLEATPDDVPIAEGLRRAILDVNRLDPAAVPQHRQRMRLLLTTPALLGHSELRCAAWREIIARYVARRTGRRPTDLLPTTAGRVSLALSLSAYETWLHDEQASLADQLAASFEALGILLCADHTRGEPADA